MAVRDWREMTVTDTAKERMRRLGKSLSEAEKPADDLVEGEALQAIVSEANEYRRRSGAALLDGAPHDDLENPPELEFYRRARALGMVPVSRRRGVGGDAAMGEGRSSRGG